LRSEDARIASAFSDLVSEPDIYGFIQVRIVSQRACGKVVEFVNLAFKGIPLLLQP